jgi:hypothetical protein
MSDDKKLSAGIEKQLKQIRKNLAELCKDIGQAG